MKETFHEEGDTFVVNQVDQDKNEYCLISLPNNDSQFNQALIKQFGSHEDKDPRDGDIMEVGVLNTILSTAQATALSRYEGRQWNITVA